MNRMTLLFTRYFAGLIGLLGAGTTYAHPGHGAHGGWLAGLTHPLTGVDHLLVAVSVGVLAALFAGLPAARRIALFLGALAIGLSAGLAGVALPGAAETLIALSVLGAGALVVWQSASIERVLWLVLCALGALHGLVHGSEAPASVGGLTYAAGILLSTGLLSVAGARVTQWLSATRTGRIVLRGGGAATAVAGVAMLVLG